jgi:hypothetical protein
MLPRQLQIRLKRFSRPERLLITSILKGKITNLSQIKPATHAFLTSFDLNMIPRRVGGMGTNING